MLRARNTNPRISAAGLRFGIAAAGYNAELAESLFRGCLEELTRCVIATPTVRQLLTTLKPSCAAGHCSVWLLSEAFRRRTTIPDN